LRCGFWSGLSLGLLRLAVLLDLLRVLLQIGGEAAVAGCIAHKIKVIRLRRIDGRAQRGDAGVADGAGRQACMFVGVVGRGRL